MLFLRFLSCGTYNDPSSVKLRAESQRCKNNFSYTTLPKLWNESVLRGDPSSCSISSRPFGQSSKNSTSSSPTHPPRHRTATAYLPHPPHHYLVPQYQSYSEQNGKSIFPMSGSSYYPSQPSRNHWPPISLAAPWSLAGVPVL